MKIKAVKRVLCFVITVVMLVISIPFTTATAATTQSTPLEYASAADGDLLYTVNFKSKHFDEAVDTTQKNMANETGVVSSNALKIQYSNIGTVASNNGGEHNLFGSERLISIAL